jgi:hemoglobin/transferrin/lactoferrin receptor protein
LTGQFHAVGNWSHSFRVPSIGERVGRAGPIATLPAPELLPEKSNTSEFGFRWRANRHTSTVTAYRMSYGNLIQSLPVTATTQQFRNTGSARIEGIEWDGQSRWSERWSTLYGLAAIRGTNRLTGVPLAGIAPLSGRASLRFDANRTLYLESAISAFRRTSRIDRTQERPRPGYGLVDIYAGLRLNRWLGDRWGQWMLVPGVTNLFNKAARNPASTELVGFSNALLSNPLYEPGRSVAFKLTVTY